MMKNTLVVAGLALLTLAGCTREERVEPVSDYESAEVQARSYNFYVFPGATYQSPQTDLLRKANTVLHPDKPTPPMAMYETDASIEDVAAFYATRYGYGAVAASDAPDAAGLKPRAYYLSGDLGAAAQNVSRILQRMNLPSDVSAAQGPFRGAHIAPSANLPRVSIQRPYFDVVNRRVVDKTSIVLVRESP